MSAFRQASAGTTARLRPVLPGAMAQNLDAMGKSHLPTPTMQRAKGVSAAPRAAR
ncbi:MAG: hypothetical protein AAF569_07815 [Pseudomonadota bacterium]